MIKDKKAVMGPVISVFVMVLVISILAGLTFLFVTSLKDTSISVSSKSTFTTRNETGAFANTSGYTLANSGAVGFASPVLIQAINSTSGSNINLGNFSVSSTGIVTNLSYSWDALNLSYTYNAVANTQAYNAINDTENAGATIVSYLSLIFLALIFGAILTLVLKLILPYINLGKTMGGDF